MLVNRLFALSLLSLALVAAGCGGGTSMRGTDDAAAGCDGPGCAVGCSSDTQCSGARPRCDKNSGDCVACLPTNDNCPTGERCLSDNGVYACSTTCNTTADCPKTDGGAQTACCTNACVDVTSSRDNCGACGEACSPVPNGTPACQGGACAIASCNPGFADCNGMIADGCETAISGDPQNCGACKKSCLNVPNASATCTNGACVPTCNPGYLHCSANPSDGCEVNGANDPANCGACGKACTSGPHSTTLCISGACQVAGCDVGYQDCNKNPSDGCEAQVLVDPANCGACGVSCAAANSATACKSGHCSITMCNAGYADCDGLPANGCEVAIGSDIKNCGACSKVCGATNGTASCTNGVCGLASCNPGYSDCDMMAADGCETQVGTDLNNCGGCGKVCAVPANAAAACANGMCGLGACKFGFADCDKMAANGCEANLLSPMTCGTCNTVCAAPANATAGCTAGMCGVGTCNALYGDCDGNAANGCEKSLAADLNNCGACNAVCAVAHGTPACLNGMCGIVSCMTGYADCDGKAIDGCEAQVANDANNCGACGNSCNAPTNAVATCANSTCGYTCFTGFGDCDKMAANGCEKNLHADVDNCGACGTVCAAVANGSPGCIGGTCGVGACNTGYADCDGNAANGCEKSTVNDVNNCGACNNVCAFANANPGCLNSQCGILSCKANYADCDNNSADGCESNTLSDPKNCGGCGKACGAQTPYCVNGACSATGCVGVVGGVILAVMPTPEYGACFYLGNQGVTCDSVCAAAGGTNLADNELAAYPDDCDGGGVGQPATYFFQNGNKCGWTGPGVMSTAYRTLGHGYDADVYYGKCTTNGLMADSGTFPGETNDQTDRCTVCACSK